MSTTTDAAELIRETAEAADTGEDWELSKHYDDLYCADLKPSVPDAETVHHQRSLPDLPNDPGVPRPADTYLHYFQARQVVLWQPKAAGPIADLIECPCEEHAEAASRVLLGIARRT